MFVDIYDKYLLQVQTIPQPLEKKEIFVRPDASEPLIPIPSVIGSSLKPVLDKMKKENTQEVDKGNIYLQYLLNIINKWFSLIYQ